MEHDDSPKGRPRSPQSKPMSAPTEAELSRVAREAVRQPPDPRLDKELARMGLMDTLEPAEPQPTRPTDPSAMIDPELVHLREQQRSIKLVLWILVAVIGILAVTVLILLFR